MSSNRGSIHSIRTSGDRISKYIEQKQKILLTTFIFRPDGTAWFLVDGELIPEKQFLAENEVCLLPMSRDNFDKTKNWMTNKKSY